VLCSRPRKELEKRRGMSGRPEEDLQLPEAVERDPGGRDPRRFSFLKKTVWQQGCGNVGIARGDASVP